MSSLLFSRASRIVGISASIGLLLSACVAITPVPGQEASSETPSGEAAASPATEQSTTLEGVTWQLTGYLGEGDDLVTPLADATMTFEAGRVSGSSGCNNFSAGYKVNGQELSITQAAGTMMACPEGTMAQEQAFLTHLGEAASYEIVDNELHILNSDGATLLTFEPQVAATLTGVTWSAISYNNGKEAVVTVLLDTEITAEFAEDGTLAGSAGCNSYSGGYSVDGDQIQIEPLATTRMFCGEPEGVMDQEAAYISALPTAARYTIQGDTLELRTADGALVAQYLSMGAANSASAEGTPAETEGATEDSSQLSGVLTGTVTYRERMALPAGSVIEVQLQDVSVADAAAAILASQTITTAGENVPIPFTLSYDPAQVDPRFTYDIRVRITVDGQLQWINQQGVAVLTGGAPVTDVEVVVQML